jgi:hypothetical protein
MGVRVEDGFGASTSEHHRGGECDNASLAGSGIHRSGSDAMGPAFVVWLDAKCPRVPRVIKFQYRLQHTCRFAFRTPRGLETSKIDVRLPARAIG